MLTDNRERVAGEYQEVLRSELMIRTPYFRRVIAENLAKLGRTNRAIELLSELADELPTQKGLHLWIAQLQWLGGSRADDLATSLRKEEERDIEVGSDWKISALSALGDSRSTSEALLKEIKTNRRVYEPLEFALRQHWPPFNSLCEDSRERWVFATERLASISSEPVYRKAVLTASVGLMVEAVERELHDRVFLSFRTHVKTESKLRAVAQEAPSKDPRARYFSDFCLGAMTHLNSAK
jgi:hypothetical protein